MLLICCIIICEYNEIRKIAFEVKYCENCRETAPGHQPLYFVDNDSIRHYQGPQKLFKIYPFISHLNQKFHSLYLPKQNIAIYKSLTLWKGRLSFLQYLPLKSSKFGIKSFELCKSIIGYIWSFSVYTGKATVINSPLIYSKTPKTAAIVLKLLEPVVGKGFTL